MTGRADMSIGKVTMAHALVPLYDVREKVCLTPSLLNIPGPIAAALPFGHVSDSQSKAFEHPCTFPSAILSELLTPRNQLTLFRI